MPFLLVALVAVGCLVVLTLTSGWTSPAGLMNVLSLAMVAGLVILPLGFYPIQAAAAMIWSVGLVTCTGGHLLSTYFTEKRHPNDKPSFAAPRESRFAFLALGLALIQLIGIISYRSRVSDLTGSEFGELDAKGIRTAESTGGGVTGLGALLFEVAPLLAVVGVIGAVSLRRLWGLLTIFALLAASLSPGRTLLLTTLAAALASWWYLRAATTGRRPRAPVAVAFLGAGLVGALIYFNLVAAELGKDAVSNIRPDTWLPEQFHSAGLYMLGGVSAMSTALELGMNPVEGYQGRSVYIFVKAISYVFPSVNPPETTAEYVWMPSPTNAFSGFGDAWFDGGLPALVFVFLVYGLLSGWAFSRSRTGSYPMVWVTSILTAQVLALPVAGHLLELSTVSWMLVGWLGLRLVSVRTSSGKVSDAPPRVLQPRQPGIKVPRPVPHETVSNDACHE